MTDQTRPMVPKVRFKGFTDEWEQRKLGEVALVRTGYAFKSKDFDRNGKFKVVTNKEFSDSTIRKNSVADKINIDSDEMIKKYNLSGQNILVTMDGVNIGKVSKFSDSNAVLAQRVGRINSQQFNFIYYIVNSWSFLNKMQRLAVGNAIKHISLKQISNYMFNAPINKEEQQKIGECLDRLGNTITLQQRKLNQLNTLKKALLQKMFADKDHPQPKFRFKGFTGDWEQRKLGEVVKRVTRKNKDNQSNLPLTISAQDGLVAQNTFFGKNVASKNLTNYILLKNGEFAYNKSYSNGYPYGSIKRLNKYDLGVISTLYIAFKPTNIDSTFLERYYDSDKWYREVYSRAAEGARNHGLLNITPHDFFDTNVSFPVTDKEQKLVGNLIDKVSKTIALQQQKLDQLNLLKKSLLQNMFVN